MYRGTDSREALVATERRSSRDTVRSHATSVGESLYASTVLSLGEQETRRRGAKPLNDQQWVLQRKRIGLSRKSMKTLQASLDTQKVKMTAITYIETHFNRKECMKFLASSASSPHCHCGSLASGHTSAALLPRCPCRRASWCRVWLNSASLSYHGARGAWTSAIRGTMRPALHGMTAMRFWATSRAEGARDFKEAGTKPKLRGASSLATMSGACLIGSASDGSGL